jgi:hypothetical protein
LARSVTDLTGSTGSTGGESTPVGLTTLMCGGDKGAAQAFRDSHPHWGYPVRTGAVGPGVGAGVALPPEGLLGVTPGAYTPRNLPGFSAFAKQSAASSSSSGDAAAAASPKRGLAVRMQQMLGLTRETDRRRES